MIDRLPTEFETTTLKRIAHNYQLAGNGQVAYSAAARRLEKLGYAAKPGTLWYVTDKGDKFLASLSFSFSFRVHPRSSASHS